MPPGWKQQRGAVVSSRADLPRCRRGSTPPRSGFVQRCAPPTPAGRGVHDATDSSGGARRCDRPVCPPPAMTICEAAAAGPCGGALFAGPLVRLEHRQSSRHEPRPGPGAMGHSVRYARRDASTRLGPALVATDDEAPTLDARARTPQGRACSAWGTRWPVPPRGRGDRAWPAVAQGVDVQLPMTLELIGPGLSSPPRMKKERRRREHALRKPGPCTVGGIFAQRHRFAASMHLGSKRNDRSMTTFPTTMMTRGPASRRHRRAGQSDHRRRRQARSRRGTQPESSSWPVNVEHGRQPRLVADDDATKPSEWR